MPDTSTLSPDIYIRGDDGTLHQKDTTGNDVAVNGWLGGVVYRNVAASTAHAASTTETLFDTSYSIPANTLKAGSVIRIKFQGIATATTAETLLVKLYIGGLTGTALLTGTATDPANNDIFVGEATVVIRTIGASGPLVAMASGNIVPAATRVAVPVYQITASTTIDTTAAQVVGVGADWSGSGSNSARLDILVVEIY
jgi:hypothetical protein